MLYRWRGPAERFPGGVAPDRRESNRLPMQLRLDSEAVARARRLAGAIVDPIEDFIARHSTVSVERAIARLCGVDGVDADGVPLPNRLPHPPQARESRA